MQLVISEKHALLVVEPAAEKLREIGLVETARRSGVHPDLIERFVQLALVEPLNWSDPRREWRFDPDTVGLVRKIMRLRRQLGINYTGIGVVLELLSRIERLERQIKTPARHR